MTIQANQGPGVSIFGATSAGGGGSTSPGGSSGQIQYNNSGAFGGLDVYYSSATLRLGAADVASGAVAQTLQVQSNTGAGTTGPNFTIKGSAGTTAGGSIIFQTAATTSYATALTINPDRTVSFISGSTAAIPINFSSNYGFYRGATQGGQAVITACSGTDIFAVGQNSGIGVVNIGPYSFSTAIGSTADVFLYRDAANTLALRNSTNAQTFRVYGSYTDASNGNWLEFIGGAFSGIYPKAQGTGSNSGLIVAGSATGASAPLYLRFQYNQSGWNISTAGNLLCDNDNALDIGATSSGRPRNVYVGNTVCARYLQLYVSGSNVGSGYLESKADGQIALFNNAGSDFNRLQFGGTTSSFPALKRISSGNCLQVIAADNTASAGFIVGNQALATTATDGFLYVPTCAGLPTGTPTTQTGTAPIVVDTTNNKLYFYSGGAWRDAGP